MCMICKNETMRPAVTTHVVTLENCVIVIKNVPCEECEQCGEKYYSDEVAEELGRIVSKAKELASEVFVMDYNRKIA